MWDQLGKMISKTTLRLNLCKDRKKKFLGFVKIGLNPFPEDLNIWSKLNCSLFSKSIVLY